MEYKLTFAQEKNAYVAYATVYANYALHIEQEEKGRIELQLKSVQDGEYADCEEQLREPSAKKPVFDKDFGHIVISDNNPKYLKIISFKPVVKASLVCDSAEV